RWCEDGLGEVQPLWLLTCLPNMPGCYIAMYNDLQGPNNTITLGDGGATLALAEAAHMIRDDLADLMIVGGCGNNLDSCSLMHVLLDEDLAEGATEPHRILRPFDRDRTGGLPAEGAAAFVLESYESAIRRGATIYGEFLGAGSSAVMEGRTPLRAAAMTNAARAALRSAGCAPENIGHIQAHGLSSRRVDADEAAAIRTIFGEAADHVPVTSAKSYFGNASAGSDAMELAAGLLALRNRKLFPVLNCNHVDADCPINPVRDNDADAGASFLKLSVTPQGQAAAIVIREAA
ncbi:MAG: beta-ketoacyl-[acyl-carrier-protein] synthase family protein, partial [Planctomycetota bacterium]